MYLRKEFSFISLCFKKCVVIYIQYFNYYYYSNCCKFNDL